MKKFLSSVLCSLVLSSCASKQAAIQTVDALRDSAQQQNVVLEQFAEQMLVEAIRQSQKAMRGELQLTHEQLKLQVFQKFDEKTWELLEYTEETLEAAMAGPLKQLLARKDELAALQAAGQGSREDVLENSVQIAAVLAVMQETKIEKNVAAIEKIQARRQRVLEALEGRVSSSMASYLITESPEAKAKRLMEAYRQQQTRRRELQDDSFQAVRDYLDQSTLGFAAFKSALLSDSLRSTLNQWGLGGLADLADEKITNWFGDLSGVIEKLKHDVLQKADEELRQVRES